MNHNNHYQQQQNWQQQGHPQNNQHYQQQQQQHGGQQQHGQQHHGQQHHGQQHQQQQWNRHPQQQNHYGQQQQHHQQMNNWQQPAQQQWGQHQQMGNMQQSMDHMNINAASFVPNINASVFVPGQGMVQVPQQGQPQMQQHHNHPPPSMHQNRQAQQPPMQQQKHHPQAMQQQRKPELVPEPQAEADEPEGNWDDGLDDEDVVEEEPQQNHVEENPSVPVFPEPEPVVVAEPVKSEPAPATAPAPAPAPTPASPVEAELETPAAVEEPVPEDALAVDDTDADADAEVQKIASAVPANLLPAGNSPGSSPSSSKTSSKSSTPVPHIIPDDLNKKNNINVIFIGHVDAGKSTIGGQLLFLTGQVDKRTLEKYEREAKEKNRETWYLSWALDTNLEERDKGKTVECGRGNFETENKTFTLLDAPGHKSFVPNMIGGAAQADIAVLVISARKGEFETGFDRGGQTREHAMLAKTAGVKHLIVLINKMDDMTVEWDQERYKEIHSKITPFLRKTGFKSSELTFMPASGFTGANLKEPLAPGLADWYKGPTFLKFLDDLPDFNRSKEGPVKMLISDRYKDMGTIVIAKVESGCASVGDKLTMMPNQHPVKIVSILGSDDTEKNSCAAGENVKIKLSNVEDDEVMPGFVLCSPDTLSNTGTVFDAQIVILEHKSIICPGYTAVLHIHNAVEEVKLVGLIATIDKKTGEKSKTRPRFIKQDMVAMARFKCSELTCLETFTDFPAMGRFTLRDEGHTIAIGKVMKILRKKEGTATATSEPPAGGAAN